jgi:hypothetical protein
MAVARAAPRPSVGPARARDRSSVIARTAIQTMYAAMLMRCHTPNHGVERRRPETDGAQKQGHGDMREVSQPVVGDSGPRHKCVGSWLDRTCDVKFPCTADRSLSPGSGVLALPPGHGSSFPQAAWAWK